MKGEVSNSLAMPAPGVGIKPEAILHKRFRSLATELEAPSDAAGPDSASAAAGHAGAPGTSAPAAEAAPGAPASADAAERNESAADEAPTPMAVDAAPAEAAAGGPAPAAGPGREEQQRRILDHILDEVIYSPRAEARSSRARVHLLTLCSCSPRQMRMRFAVVPVNLVEFVAALRRTRRAACCWLSRGQG